MPARTLNRAERLELYRLLRLTRTVEERLVRLYRQGKVVGGLYRCLGQEATSVGTAFALAKGDVIGPMIRNLGAVLTVGGSPRGTFSRSISAGRLLRREARTATSISELRRPG